MSRYLISALHILLMVIKMKLVIGNMDRKLQAFIKRCKFTERVLLINKMCNVKTISDDVDVIIPYGIIMPNGLVSSTYVHLEELIITVNVRKIIYTNIYNKNILEKLKDRYKFELEYMKITDSMQNFTF